MMDFGALVLSEARYFQPYHSEVYDIRVFTIPLQQIHHT